MNQQRSPASPHDGTGDQRYAILKAGALQASNAFVAGFYIEAIVLTEGILWCRMASRYQHVTHKQADEKANSVSLGKQACAADKGPDVAGFAAVTERIDGWLRNYRNPLAHAAAKLLDKNGSSFATNMARAREGAEIGFRILVDLETLDMKSRLTNGWLVENRDSKVRPPASHPDAFDSIRSLVQQPPASQVLAAVRKRRA
ncbi:MAG: hypothetical protein WAT39_07755 [Planctomycetota bacterium]